MLCFIFNYRHYKLVVRGLNITFIKVILIVNLKTFHWHLKDGTIGSLGEISSPSKNIRRQVKIITCTIYINFSIELFILFTSCSFCLIFDSNVHPKWSYIRLSYVLVIFDCVLNKCIWGTCSTFQNWIWVGSWGSWD